MNFYHSDVSLVRVRVLYPGPELVQDVPHGHALLHGGGGVAQGVRGRVAPLGSHDLG